MYNILFKDGETWQGGEPNNSHWLEIPKKPIHEIRYKIASRLIVMKNYESYNHIIKVGVGITGTQNGIIRIYLCGKFRNKVQRVIIDFNRNRIFQDVVEYGQEYQGKPHQGWTPIFPSLNPTYGIK